ncbi:helix-turn-helix domain-containing protein [Streptomyces olivoreticuli]|uniref:helix-turn-helix domain-containing protein n=1 Tax=Streptomyces olivoreticuli TaxID=68246 RepID=UPI00265AEE07|nr:helix-turn-helix domain-containing protein [Streptomyces olivoreticuli]WKK20836.1 helix-turn-helix domain-containing protein [Streptomyces olivoreticuli]
MAWRHGTDRSRSADLAGARVARHATASLAGLVAERGMSRKELADRMGVSPGRVSQILSGDENLTLRSLAAVAEALEVGVEVCFFEQTSTEHREPLETVRPGAADQSRPLAPSHR